MSHSNEKMKQQQEEKILELRKRGIDPYPAEINITHTVQEFSDKFQELLDNGHEAVLCGRVNSFRKHGKIIFTDIADGTGTIQGIFNKESYTPEEFSFLKQIISRGDFLEISGTPYVTNRAVNSIQIDTWKMVAKALVHVPDSHFGLNDEQRYRRRYLDMLTNPEVIELIKKKSMFWNSVRNTMIEDGFLEVETPILEPSAVGAKARQFQAHHNALDMDVYLRISSEIAQKQLIIGGLPKVFEIGRVFRNEGMSPEHAQDYTAFEFYEAYQDARKGVPFTIDVIKTAAKKAFGTLQFNIKEKSIDLEKEWERISFCSLIEEKFQFSPLSADTNTVLDALNRHGIGHSPKINFRDAIGLCWKTIQKDIDGPSIVTDIPYYFAPLGKRSQHDNRLVDEYKIIICGVEVGHMFNELNDPIDQRKRLSMQQANVEDLTTEELLNGQYVEALEYGMPPVFGFGCSERLFSILANTTIREAQAFPLVKPNS